MCGKNGIATSQGSESANLIEKFEMANAGFLEAVALESWQLHRRCQDVGHHEQKGRRLILPIRHAATAAHGKNGKERALGGKRRGKTTEEGRKEPKRDAGREISVFTVPTIDGTLRNTLACTSLCIADEILNH